MKTFFRLIFAALVIGVIVLLLTNKSNLVGTWEDDSGATITFEKGGQGKMVYYEEQELNGYHLNNAPRYIQFEWEANAIQFDMEMEVLWRDYPLLEDVYYLVVGDTMFMFYNGELATMHRK